MRLLRTIVMAVSLAMSMRSLSAELTVDFGKIEKRLVTLGGQAITGTLKNPEVIEDGGTYRLQCVIPKATWEAQRAVAAKQLEGVRKARSFASKMRFLAPLLAGAAGVATYVKWSDIAAGGEVALKAYLGYMNKKVTVTRDDLFLLGTCGAYIGFLAGMITFAVSQSRACCSAPQRMFPSSYDELTIIEQYLTDIQKESSDRIIGFRKIQTCSNCSCEVGEEHILIETDFPVNEMLRQ